MIEKAFDDIKNHIDMKSLSAHFAQTTEGKLFCAFISLIVVSVMGDKLRNTKRKSGMSKDGLIKELEKIRLFKDENGRRLINPLTKTQRKIFAPFGLEEENVKKYIGKNA